MKSSRGCGPTLTLFTYVPNSCAPLLNFNKRNLKDNSPRYYTSLSWTFCPFNFSRELCSFLVSVLGEHVESGLLSRPVSVVPVLCGSTATPGSQGTVSGPPCSLSFPSQGDTAVGLPAHFNFEINHWNNCCHHYMLLIKLGNCFSTQIQSGRLCGSKWIFHCIPVIILITTVQWLLNCAYRSGVQRPVWALS